MGLVVGDPIISQRSSLERLGLGGLEGLDNMALADLGRSISGSSDTDVIPDLGCGLAGSITSLRLALGLDMLDSWDLEEVVDLTEDVEEGVRGFIPRSLNLESDLARGVIPFIGVSTRQEILLLRRLLSLWFIFESGCCNGGLE